MGRIRARSSSQHGEHPVTETVEYNAREGSDANSVLADFGGRRLCLSVFVGNIERLGGFVSKASVVSAEPLDCSSTVKKHPAPHRSRLNIPRRDDPAFDQWEQQIQEVCEALLCECVLMKKKIQSE
jgi:hypothetical protein